MMRVNNLAGPLHTTAARAAQQISHTDTAAQTGGVTCITSPGVSGGGKMFRCSFCKVASKLSCS